MKDWTEKPTRVDQVNKVAALYGYRVKKGAALFLLEPMRGARSLLIPAPTIIRLSDLSLDAWRLFIESSIRDLEERLGRARLVIGYSVTIGGERYRGRIDLDEPPPLRGSSGPLILSIIRERHPSGYSTRYGVLVPGRDL